MTLSVERRSKLMKVFYVECQVSTGKENQKKKATVLKMVSGKQPLHDSTSAILNRPPVEPKPSQSTSEAAIDEDAVLDPLACADNSPPSSPGYLDDLLREVIGLGDSRRETK